MILCVNPNAAIDKTVIVPGFRLNEIQRPERVLAIPGGKGCNVARALKVLGESPVVTGWVGGFAGQFIEAGLRAEGIGSAFVQTAFESRTCLSILDPDARTMTELYEKGDDVPAEQVDAFVRWFSKSVGQYAAVTLSGSLPPGVPADLYARLTVSARAAGVPVMLDAGGEALRAGIEASPFLVKPNEEEFAGLVGDQVRGGPELARAAREIAVRHRTLVVISLGADGALAADLDGAWHVRPPRVRVVSAVGSGDSMLAGITWGVVRGLALPEAVRHGVAAGTANALTVGAGVFTKTDFERVLLGVDVTSLASARS
jgi:tagatose 6-phosphate kinase